MPIYPPTQYGKQLAYASYDVDSVNLSFPAASGIIDISALSISFVVVDRPVMVEMFIPAITQSNAGGITNLHITDGSNVIKGSSYGIAHAAGVGGTIQVQVRELITTPGSYTRKGRASATANTSTITGPVAGAAELHPFIRAVQV